MPSAKAQTTSPNINTNPLVIRETYLKPDNIPGGANAELIIRFELPAGFHAYADQFKLNIKIPESTKNSRLKLSPIVEFHDVFTKKMRQGIEGRGEVLSVVELPEDLSNGPSEMQIDFIYQACTKDYCLFPATAAVKIPFVGQTKDGDFGWSLTTAATNMPLLESALKRGWFFAFLISFLAGILTSFTPCIFPMIPITLAVLGARSHEHTTLQRFRLSLSYVAGISITYSILGLIAAYSGSLFGAFLGHPAVAVGLFFLFIAMGFSMFGLFEVQAPVFIRQRLGLHKSQGGSLGAFLTGIMAGVLASPCVGPVLVSILAWVAKTQNLLFGFALLFIFAFGMGQLFLLIGTFGVPRWWPKSGAWLNLVKFIFGSILLGLALFYLRPVASLAAFKVALGLVLIAVGVYHGALNSPNNKSLAQKLSQGFMLLLVLLGLGFSIHSFYLQHMNPKSTEEQKSEHLVWENFTEEKLNAAIQSGRPIVIDFYADWCVACKELELNTFSDPRVNEKLKEFVLLRFDATEDSPIFNRLRKRYEIIGLPWLIFYDKNGKYQKTLVLAGFENAEDFLKRLEKAASH